MIRRIERKGGVKWQARVGSNGALRTFDFKYQAEEYEANERKNRQRERAGLDHQQGPITFDELAELYIANFDPSDWRLTMLAHSRERWGSTKVRSIKPESFGAWLHGLKKADKTKKHILETARQVFKAGVEWGYLSKSPVRPGAFKAPREGRIREIRPFESWGEVEAVAKAVGAYLPISDPLIRFVCATGLSSPSEWLHAEARQINREARQMIVHGTKTENRPRTIPLQQRALNALDELPKVGRLFHGREPSSPLDYANWRRNEWRKGLEDAGVDPRTPYEMRHTFATLSLEAGAHLEDVSKVLGHGSIDITRRFYAKWTKPRLDRFRDLLDERETG